MSSWHSYPKIYSLGHAALKELFDCEVIIQEKVDGSQFSFGVIDGVLRVRSKGVEMDVNAPEKMFALAVTYVKSISDKLIDGWTYRGEYLQKPKHNTLAYDRVPLNHVILFDINSGEEQYHSYDSVCLEAARLGFEVVPALKAENSAEGLLSLLDRTSCLGGAKIEGIVIKNYSRFGPDKKALMGKYVSEAFKEIHGKDWKARHPTTGDVVELIGERYRTPARWQKAVQHLRDAGQLEGTPKDIAKLVVEAKEDLRKECEDEIRAALFAAAWPKIERAIVRGMPEWYKKQLLGTQFSAVDPLKESA